MPSEGPHIESVELPDGTYTTRIVYVSREVDV